MSSLLMPHFTQYAPSAIIDGKRTWMVGGDLLMDEGQLVDYAKRRARIAANPPPAEDAGLIVKTNAANHYLRWAADKVLTYRVRASTFGAHYQTIVDSLSRAAESWQQICLVRFEHRADLDELPGTGAAGAVFWVEFDSAGANHYYADAFAPDTIPASRRLKIYPAYFGGNMLYDPVGLLRHESGHILGFQHEHEANGAPAECIGDPAPIVDPGALTPYDRWSVMHYLCRSNATGAISAGSIKLEFTQLDKIAAQALYGMPQALYQVVQ